VTPPLVRQWSWFSPVRHRLTALLLAIALLAPGVAAAAAAGAAEVRAAHACCPERVGTSCHGLTIACCPPTDAPARSAALPASPSASLTAGVLLLDGPLEVVNDVAAAARLAARLAHAADACLQAPADPLFLKHLVLLV
jgi:hypothetical protein